MKIKNGSRDGFTLVELLVVIGILIVLVVVALFFLNPSQLLSQGRDSNRVSDITTLNQNLALYHETVPAGSLGTSGILYISIPDPAATSTAGDQCQGLGLSAVSGYTYHCAATSTYRNNNGTGWVPVNFSTIPGNQLGVLPIDPTNTTTSNEYYVYVTSGTQYEFMANPEATKTIANATSSFTQGSGSALAVSFPSSSGGPITFTTSTYAVEDLHDGVAFDSHTNSIWVANLNDDSVTQIDDTTYATSTHTVAGDVYAITFDPHTNTIWTANEDNNNVTQVNDTTYATSTYAVGNAPDAITFDSHTNTIWTANFTDHTVTQINDTTFATSTYAVGNDAYAITFDSHTNSIWVVNQDSVIQINDTTYATSSYALATTPDTIAFDSHTNTIWTAGEADNSVTQINDTTYATSTYALGSSPDGMAFDSHTNSIWSTDEGDSAVTQINDTTYATSTYAADDTPDGVAFDSHTNSIWVADYAAGDVLQFAPSH